MAKWSDIWSAKGLTRAQKAQAVAHKANPAAGNYRRPPVRVYRKAEPPVASGIPAAVTKTFLTHAAVALFKKDDDEARASVAEQRVDKELPKGKKRVKEQRSRRRDIA